MRVLLTTTYKKGDKNNPTIYEDECLFPMTLKLDH